MRSLTYTAGINDTMEGFCGLRRKESVPGAVLSNDAPSPDTQHRTSVLSAISEERHPYAHDLPCNTLSSGASMVKQAESVLDATRGLGTSPWL